MPPATKKATDLNGTLESVRRDLLDLGLRNTLLNYRPLRSKGVDVIDEDPVEVFRILLFELPTRRAPLAAMIWHSQTTSERQRTGTGTGDGESASELR
jgi:hypothetical protein